MTKQTTVKGTAAMKEWLKNQGISYRVLGITVTPYSEEVTV